MSSKDKANLLAILDAIERIKEYVSAFKCPDEYFKSKQAFDATLMNFINIGEMVERLSKELRERHRSIDWQKINDFRNLVAHDYLGVDAEEVWQIIKNDLPPLKKQLNLLLNNLK